MSAKTTRDATPSPTSKASGKAANKSSGKTSGKGSPRGDDGPGRGRSMGSRIAGWLRGSIVDNAAIKLVALILALTVYILVQSDEQAVAGAQVDVTYSMPRDRVLVSERVDQVRIVVKGSRRAIRRFHRQDLEPIHIDLKGARSGQLFFSDDMLELPEGVELVSTTPSSMAVDLEKRMEKTVSVVVDPAGAPGRGYRVRSMVADPPQIEISGAETVVRDLESIRTAEVNLAGRTRGFRASARLSPPTGVDIDGRELVHVQIDLEEDHGSRELTLPVTLVAGRGIQEPDLAKLTADPGEITVVMRGTVLALDEVETDELNATVKVEAGDLSRGKDWTSEVRVMPKLSGVAFEVTPPEITLRAGE